MDKQSIFIGDKVKFAQPYVWLTKPAAKLYTKRCENSERGLKRRHEEGK